LIKFFYKGDVIRSHLDNGNDLTDLLQFFFKVISRTLSSQLALMLSIVSSKATALCSRKTSPSLFWRSLALDVQNVLFNTNLQFVWQESRYIDCKLGVRVSLLPMNFLGCKKCKSLGFFFILCMTIIILRPALFIHKRHEHHLFSMRNIRSKMTVMTRPLTKDSRTMHDKLLLMVTC
jgi:hypothetical protein